MSKQESFPVLSISREDVTRAMGYNPDVQLTDYQLQSAELTDYQMQVIASKFGDALSEVASEIGFWKVLADVVESWLGTKEELEWRTLPK